MGEPIKLGPAAMPMTEQGIDALSAYVARVCDWMTVATPVPDETRPLGFRSSKERAE